MYSKQTILLICFIAAQAQAWDIPAIPSGRRTQFYAIENNGAYKYGYDTGAGNAAKQSADAANQVEGHYFYKNAAGQDIDLKYTAGVQGFVPEGLDKIYATVRDSSASGYQYQVPQVQASGYQYQAPQAQTSGYQYQVPQVQSQTYSQSHDDQANTGDSSYSFAFDTPTYKRQEVSDASGNVQGAYSYNNEAGTHNIQYVAGPQTGFVATSSSTGKSYGLSGYGQTKYAPVAQNAITYNAYAPVVANAVSSVKTGENGAYSFEYNTGDNAHQQSGDANGNVQGSYSYKNAAGTHDLSYVAGAATGFQVTGGSLAVPNGLKEGQAISQYSVPQVSLVPQVSQGYHYTAPAQSVYAYQGADSSAYASNAASSDGSYSYAYNTGDSSKQESADAANNVRGSYSYQNEAGNHDLSYVAGSATGFQVTGGSLAQPNGLGQVDTVVKSAPLIAPVVAPVVAPIVAPTSYLPPVQQISVNSVDDNSQDDQANTGDSSYSFTIDTDEYKRVESSDASGNVQGSYSYKNNAGTHDLSYVAGSQTGFVATGGSLSDPNAIAAKIAAAPAYQSVVTDSVDSGTYLPPTDSITVNSANSEESTGSSDEANTGDASYSFSFDTDEYKRQESSDAQGNVQGSFTYKNGAGSHDLSFVAGSATGFVPTSGTLKTAPGLNEVQLRSGANEAVVTKAYLPPVVHEPVVAPVVQAPVVHAPLVQAPVVTKAYLPPIVQAPVVHTNLVQTYTAPIAPTVHHVAPLPEAKLSYNLDNVSVKTYLPPSSEHGKYGYIIKY